MLLNFFLLIFLFWLLFTEKHEESGPKYYKDIFDELYDINSALAFFFIRN